MLIIFYIFAALSILGGLGVLFLRNPIHCALSLVGTFFCLGAIYVMLNAEFVAVIQVLVYAGAIMVLFMFIIMLLNLRGNEPIWKSRDKNVVLSFLGFLLAVGAFIKLFSTLKTSGLNQGTQLGEDFGTTALVGKILFTDYLLPFEIASILLLVAIIGAVMLAKTKID